MISAFLAKYISVSEQLNVSNIKVLPLSTVLRKESTSFSGEREMSMNKFITLNYCSIIRNLITTCILKHVFTFSLKNITISPIQLCKAMNEGQKEIK